MAKKTNVLTAAPGMDKRHPSARLSVKAQDGLKFTTGEPVTLTIKGTLKSVNAKDWDGFMSIELEPVSVVAVKAKASASAGSLSEDLATLAKSRGGKG